MKTEEEKAYQRYLDSEDKVRIMQMNPNDMNLAEFLVYKDLLICTDLKRNFNLQTTRDCHVGTVEKIIEAMNEWADIRSKDAVFYWRASHLENP